MANIVESHEDAYSQCMANLRLVTDGATVVGILGAALRVDYPQVRANAPTPSGTPYCRGLLLLSGEKRRTLSTPSRVTKLGMMDIQLCMPRPWPNVALQGLQIAGLLEKAVQGSTDGVVFYKSFVRPMPPDEVCFIWRITATTNYDIMEG